MRFSLLLHLALPMAWYRAQVKTLTTGEIPASRIGHTFTHIPGPVISTGQDANVRAVPSPGHCVLLGGYDGTQCLNFESADILSVDSLTWSTLSCVGDVPAPRTGHCCAHIGGDRLMIFGGRDRSTYFGDAYMLDLPTGMWSRIRTREERDADGSSTGSRGARSSGPPSGMSSSIQNLNGPSALAEQACVLQNGRVLAWGGSGADKVPNETMMSFDPREGLWYSLRPAQTAVITSHALPEPPARVGHSIIARPDVATLLLVGGVSETLMEAWNAHKGAVASQTRSQSSGIGSWCGRGDSSVKQIAWKQQEDAPLRVYDCRMTKWFPPLTDVAGAANLNQRSARRNHVAALTPTGIMVQGGLDYDGKVLSDWFLIHPWTLQGLRRPVAEIEETPGARFGHTCAVALSRGALVFGGADLVDEGGSGGGDGVGIGTGGGGGGPESSSGGSSGKTSLRCHSETHVMAW